MVDKLKVLVVDDNASFLKTIEEVLQTESYVVLPASDMGNAWDIYQQQCPDIVLTDVHLDPDDVTAKSGIQLMEKITQNAEPGKQRPVILMSSDPSVKEFLERSRPEAIDFLSKPFDPSTLLEKIAEHIK